MRLYPARPAGTIAGDVTVIVLLVVFAWLGFKVHDAVAELASLGRGLQGSGRAVATTARDASGAVRDGLDTAAGAVQQVPLIGGQVAGALRSAGQSATRPVQREADAEAQRLIAAGREGEHKAYALANLLGWLTFITPAVLLLTRALPPRIAQIRRLTATRDLLTGAPEVELARRAAFNLPYARLARHTRDPFGDLAAGRHAGLIAALEEDAGTRLTGRGRGLGAAAAPPDGT